MLAPHLHPDSQVSRDPRSGRRDAVAHQNVAPLSQGEPDTCMRVTQNWGNAVHEPFGQLFLPPALSPGNNSPGSQTVDAPSLSSTPGPSGVDEDSITPFVYESERGDLLSSEDSEISGDEEDKITLQPNVPSWGKLLLSYTKMPQRSL